jgi:hypothetical protein
MRSWIWKVVTALSLALLTIGCSKTETESDQKGPQGKSIPVGGKKGKNMPPLPP